MKIFHIDTKSVFLNDDTRERVYMIPPLSVSQNPMHVYKSRKTFNCLKQAPKTWFGKFSIVIAFLGFCSNGCDSTLFFKTTSHVCIIPFYMSTT